MDKNGLNLYLILECYGKTVKWVRFLIVSNFSFLKDFKEVPFLLVLEEVDNFIHNHTGYSKYSGVRWPPLGTLKL